jgi:hypothetical protein
MPPVIRGAYCTPLFFFAVSKPRNKNKFADWLGQGGEGRFLARTFKLVRTPQVYSYANLGPVGARVAA